MPYIHDRDDFERLVLPGKDGPGTEGIHLDFKRDIAERTKGDPPLLSTALDLAAFANADGGTLVFGVTEERPAGETKARATGLHAIDVDATIKHVEDALTNHTYGFDERPRPWALEVGGGTVVVVNVYPAPRLIAVRNGNRAIHYPVRHTYGNDYLKPEEIQARLDARYPSRFRWQLQRRLRDSPEGMVFELFVLTPAKANPPRAARLFNARSTRLVECMADGAVISFVSATQKITEFTLPYEWIVSVWNNQEKKGPATVSTLAIQVAAHMAWRDSNEQAIYAFPIPWA